MPLHNSAPRFSVKLPGSFWGITSFFNPYTNHQRIMNYRLFREMSQKQGLKLITVELIFGDQSFQLGKADAEQLVRVQVDKNDILWQKERLLNLGLRHLPEDCDKVAWIDADVVFCDNHWVAQASLLLETFITVQLFSSYQTIRGGYYSENGLLPATVRYPQWAIRGFVYGLMQIPPEKRGNYQSYGWHGLAWAARRSLLDCFGFYDRLIMGGGDAVMSNAFAGTKDGAFRRMQNTHLTTWYCKVKSAVKGSIGYLDSQLFHLYHGEYYKRFYADRYLMIKPYRFDPERDIQTDRHGCWIWATPKKGLHRMVQFYFWIRSERLMASFMMVAFLLRLFFTLLHRIEWLALRLRFWVRRFCCDRQV